MGSPPAVFHENVRRLFELGRAAWPGLDLDEEVFRSHVATRLPPDGAVPGAIDPIARDLYLACACFVDAPGALARFERHYLSQVSRFVARMDSSPAFADEVRQILLERLMVAPPGGAKRIGDYAGRGTLIPWIRVVALRIAIDLQRQRKPHRHEPIDDDIEAAAGALDPELQQMKERYATAFNDAVRAAFATITSQQRMVLRLTVIDNLSGDQIAALLRVNRATVVRRLAASREAIRDETQRILAERLRLDTAEVDSLRRLVQSQVDISLGSLLRDGGE